MTRQEAITEERRRYLEAIRLTLRDRAHVHLLAMHRLRGNGYCSWERHTDIAI